MDTVLGDLVAFVEASNFDVLTASAVERVVTHTVDTIGCGAGGYASEPAEVVRTVMRGAAGAGQASMYGEPQMTPVGAAAFANATANRYLDFNDFGVSGHPSDMIPAVLAAGEASGASGREAVNAIALAYELATRFAHAVPADGGWDQGVYCALGVAAAQAKLRGLNRVQTANALSLAVVPTLPLRVTRFGQLSEWKAAATGHANLTATLATDLAAAGMTGPGDPFTGKDGLLERVWPSFDLDLGEHSSSAIERASLKRHPACYWGQVPIDLVLEIRDRVPLDQLIELDVQTCVNAWRSIGGGRGDAKEKWRPPTRETADHSMPYLMAVVLTEGSLVEGAFDAARLADPSLHALMDRISVTERSDLSARATRDSCPTEVTATLSDGTKVRAAADVPRGHHAKPMSHADVSAKFQDLAAASLPPAKAVELEELLWGLTQASSLTALGALFRAFSRR